MAFPKRLVSDPETEMVRETGVRRVARRTETLAHRPASAPARGASLSARPAWGQGPGPRCDERGGSCLPIGRGKSGGLMCRCCGHLVRAEPVASGVRRAPPVGDGAPRPRARKKKTVKKKKKASEATLWQRRNMEIEERMRSAIDPFVREHGSQSTDMHADDDAADLADSPAPGDNRSTRIAASSQKSSAAASRRRISERDARGPLSQEESAEEDRLQPRAAGGASARGRDFTGRASGSGADMRSKLSGVEEELREQVRALRVTPKPQTPNPTPQNQNPQPKLRTLNLSGNKYFSFRNAFY